MKIMMSRENIQPLRRVPRETVRKRKAILQSYIIRDCNNPVVNVDRLPELLEVRFVAAEEAVFCTPYVGHGEFSGQARCAYILILISRHFGLRGQYTER